MKKAGIVSLGCPKNLIDSEIMLATLRDEGYELTDREEDAQLIIVNTCGFIESAKQESINAILEMAEYKKKKCEFLIVAGCLAERYRDKILEEVPEVDAVIGTGNYGELEQVLKRVQGGEKPLLFGRLDTISHLNKKRVITTNTGWAYIKIAEGCDNCCTYCVIPSLRGPFRSRKMEDILEEASHLASTGVREIILVAQDTTSYGKDLYKKRMISELVQSISRIDGIEWIRLLYCYPEEIDEMLVDVIATNEKVCKYIDIPIQHASDRILKAMGRRGKSDEIRRVIMRLRERIPDICIRTTVIVGFPGESDADFDELYNFVKELQFDRLGVFMYSREEGTPASKMKPQVRKSIKQKRYDEIMRLQKDIAIFKNSQRLNRAYRVIVEGISDDGLFYVGRSFAEAPEIDGNIYFTSSRSLQAGNFINIIIVNTNDYDLVGVDADEPSE